MKLSIAVAGKGGIGKTTLSALFVRSLKEMAIRPVLAVDADANSNLAEALGIEAGTPLAEIREASSSPEGSPASGMGRVRSVEDEIQRAIAEDEGFDLITMGRPEGPKCYCYVNNLLRTSLDSLARNYTAVVLDNEAGMEHLSRRTTDDIDILIAVMNPTAPSVRAAKRIIDLSRQLPIKIKHRAVLVNRVGPEGAGTDTEDVLAELGAMRLADIPQDDDVERVGAAGRDVFCIADTSPALTAVKGVVQTLLDTMSAE